MPGEVLENTDRYLCNNANPEYITDFLPPDATGIANVPGIITLDDVIPVGARYDVVVRALVPEEAVLGQMRLFWGIRDLTAEDRRPYLPLEGLPVFD